MTESKHFQTSCQNGLLHLPSSTCKQSHQLPCVFSPAVRCSSESSSSTSSLTPVNKPKQPLHVKPTTLLASSSPLVPHSHKLTATLPAGQKSAAVPTKYLAIDCEMVGSGPNGCISQLARCSIVSHEGDVIYDKFINPSVPVTNYRTRWSGIRRRDLIRATPYSEARKEILKLLNGKVVIGHAIHNDFKVLAYYHPPALTRDTSRIPLLNQKAGFAEKECVSLKRLAKAVLNLDIQVDWEVWSLFCGGC
ncbi:interferon-stimulated 20 kDa exonuclease-like 2 isoform X2 [Thalassophryne amazonica]|uniref:interferon-stimulated 20 kDa exonuclease-like 2 isoform X2 n=1 Tax=Thalassophryne amazonica TaxID=390379 RepID=UPI0014711B32|nr:interferon-stimulated 20 kDa exonuclease-like 2 isoform X2 [Thalassophryne amazonica]